MVPLDVIKTRIQTDASLSKMSLKEAFKAVVSRGGGNRNVLLQGLAATSTGYLVQGFFKFGGYELFKQIGAANFAGAPRVPILVASSCLAEIVASVYMCPLEATRIFMVLNTEEAKRGMVHSMATILKREGPRGFFKGLNYILLRQIPYTCVKLAGYDWLLDNLRKGVFAINSKLVVGTVDEAGVVGAAAAKRGGPRAAADTDRVASTPTLQILTGVIVGVAAAAVSHPADVLLSRVCGSGSNVLADQCAVVQNAGDLFGLAKDIGMRNLWAGLEPRAIMVGTMTAIQFLVYESVRSKIANTADAFSHQQQHHATARK